MALAAGTYRFGPDNATLSVRTGRTGAAAKAGHDLLLHITAWHATLEVGGGSAGSSLVLDADAASIRVREGTGGMQVLDDDDKANIEQTIDDEVLKGQAIGFRSTSVEVATGDGRLEVSGELTLLGATHPIAFDVAVDADGMLRGTAVVKQSDWGMKPYTALFGALKVADEVEVAIDASTRSADPRRVTEEPPALAPPGDGGASALRRSIPPSRASSGRSSSHLHGPRDGGGRGIPPHSPDSRARGVGCDLRVRSHSRR